MKDEIIHYQIIYHNESSSLVGQEQHKIILTILKIIEELLNKKNK